MPYEVRFKVEIYPCNPIWVLEQPIPLFVPLSRCSTVGFYSTGVVGSREGVGETNNSGSGELSG